MSVEHHYNLCRRSIGRAVEIRTRDGRIHRGIIRSVNPGRVFIQPLGRPGNLGGYGYGFGGYGGYGYGIGLGTIAWLALLPFFFW